MQKYIDMIKNMTDEEIEEFDHDGTCLAEDFTQTFTGRKEKLIDALEERKK